MNFWEWITHRRHRRFDQRRAWWQRLKAICLQEPTNGAQLILFLLGFIQAAAILVAGPIPGALFSVGFGQALMAGSLCMLWGVASGRPLVQFAAALSMLGLRVFMASQRLLQNVHDSAWPVNFAIAIVCAGVFYRVLSQERGDYESSRLLAVNEGEAEGFSTSTSEAPHE